MADNNDFMHVRVNEIKKTRFIRKCERNEEVPAVVIRQLMDSYTKGTITISATAQHTRR